MSAVPECDAVLSPATTLQGDITAAFWTQFLDLCKSHISFYNTKQSRELITNTHGNY